MLRRLIAGCFAAAVVMALVIAVTLAQDTSPNKVRSSISARSGTGLSAAAQDDPFSGPEPSVQDQITRLKGWYASEPADAPGGRPVLAAEFVSCHLNDTQQNGRAFASDMPLDASLDSSAFVRACAGSAAGSGHTGAEISLGEPMVCAANLRGPIYSLNQSSVQPVVKPVVVYGQSCETAGYLPATASFMNALNARRALEIKMRAVPRDCPTYVESASWVRKIASEAGLNFTVAELPPMTNDCVFHFYVDWDANAVYMR